jgi:hypothetical protein
MTLQNHPATLPPKAHGTVAGCWSLMPGTALSLLPREAGVLRIASGRVWATVDGPHRGHGNESGDHFLQAGEALAVRGGQRLVFEPWSTVADTPVYFDWTPSGCDGVAPATHWQLTVVQPARDLCHAVLSAVHALGRLLLGLATSPASVWPGRAAPGGVSWGRRVTEGPRGH